MVPVQGGIVPVCVSPFASGNEKMHPEALKVHHPPTNGGHGAVIPAARDTEMNQDHSEMESQIPADAAEETTGDDTQSVIEALRGELEQLRAERLLERADLENQRRRLARDVDQARKFANEKLLNGLLPVFDSLDAGLTAAAGQEHPLKEGMDLTYKQLLKVAADNGMVVIDPVGTPFNPEQHQAISQIDPPAGVAPGAVVTVFQKGYVLNDRLLRPALVVVARND